MTIRITKAKIKNSQMELAYNRIDGDNSATVEVSEKLPYIVHPDLTNTFVKLRKHLAKLCDLIEGDVLNEVNFEKYLAEDLLNLFVTSFTISGDDDNEGVVITGGKKLASGKVINLNTPFTRFRDEVDPYLFEDDLYVDIQACIYEIEEYLKGKFAIKQMEIPFDGDPDDEGVMMVEFQETA